MKSRHANLFLLGISLAGLAIAYFILEFFNCGNSSFCFHLYTDVGKPLFYGTLALSVIFIVLLFVPQAFNSWKRFAMWFVPLAAVLFATWPTSRGGGLGVVPTFIGPSATQIYQWISALYVLISLAIIARVKFRK